MDKKTQSPYGKILLTLITLLFAAGLIAPQTRSYVNNASYNNDRDKDMQISIILENLVMQQVRGGELTLSKELGSEEVEAKLSKFLGRFPAINQEGHFFCLNLTDGKVNVKKVKGESEIIINHVKGD